MRHGLTHALVIGLVAAGLSAQEVITVVSGGGAIGGTDPLVTHLPGPINGAFTTAFTLANFTAAAGGPSAQIPPVAGGWISPLPQGPGAQWIATSQSAATQGTALYAVPFTVLSPSFATASLDVTVATDDNLGDAINEGVFVNGIPVAGTRVFGAYYFQTRFTNLDVSGSVVPGLNILYLNGVDTAGAGGLIFSATITIRPTCSLSLGMPLARGGVGVVQLTARHLPGFASFILPNVLPPLPVGSGIAIGSTEWLLSLNDPLLGFALYDPNSAAIFSGIQGFVSPINGRAVALVFVPNDPSLAGGQITWQGLIATPASSTPIEASDLLATTIL